MAIFQIVVSVFVGNRLTISNGTKSRTITEFSVDLDVQFLAHHRQSKKWYDTILTEWEGMNLSGEDKISFPCRQSKPGSPIP